MNALASKRFAADSLFDAGNWHAAEIEYRTLLENSSSSAIRLRVAECCFARRDFESALAFASAASQNHRTLFGAVEIQRDVYRILHRTAQWHQFATRCVQLAPDNHNAQLQLAEATLAIGDHAQVRSLLKPLLTNAQTRERALWLSLMVDAYDRPLSLSPTELTARFAAFAGEYIAPFAQSVVLKTTYSARPHDVAEPLRIGFVGAGFYGSADYWLATPTLDSLIAKGHSVFLLSRSAVRDEFTGRLESSGAEWLNCAGMSAAELHYATIKLGLDELYDLAGWSDLDVLKLMTTKPARQQFAWFGPRICSTGLKVYDGLITDTVITPPETYTLYSERLISIGGARAVRDASEIAQGLRATSKASSIRQLKTIDSPRVGVCAPPACISKAFLLDVRKLICSLSENARLVFIDPAFESESARQRVRQLLNLKNVHVDFVLADTSQARVGLLSELDYLLDTFPISSGAVLIEAVAIGLPVHLFPYERRLYSERLCLSLTGAR